MSPSEIKKAIEGDLPHGMEIGPAHYYSVSFVFTDSSGDKCEISVDYHGEVVTREQADSSGSKNGTAFPADVFMFLWRVTRMAQDKPW